MNNNQNTGMGNNSTDGQKKSASESATEDQILNVNALTPTDAHRYIDLRKTIKKIYPKEMTLNVPDFEMEDITSFLYKGSGRKDEINFSPIGQEPPISDEFLKAEVRFPYKDYRSIQPASNVYVNKQYEEFLESLPRGQYYDPETTELLHRHPDLKGAMLRTNSHTAYKHLYIEGQHIDKWITWLLQEPGLTGKELKTLLNDPIAEQKHLEKALQQTILKEQQMQTFDKNAPEGLLCFINRRVVYMYEKGILGFVGIDYNRNVRYSGEKLSQQAQQYIDDFARNKNMIIYGNKPYFLTPSGNGEEKIFLDKRTKEWKKVNIQQNVNGKPMVVLFESYGAAEVIDKENMQHYHDITGRITDAHIYNEYTRPAVRCKIDGIQRSGRCLKGPEIEKSQRIYDIYVRSKSIREEQDKRMFEFSMAVKYFAEELCQTPEQQLSKGMKK